MIPIIASGQAALVLLVSGVAIAVAGVVSLLMLGRYAIQQPAKDARARGWPSRAIRRAAARRALRRRCAAASLRDVRQGR